MRVSVSLYLIHKEYLNPHSTRKVRTSLQSGGLLVGLRNILRVKTVNQGLGVGGGYIFMVSNWEGA